MELLGPTLNMNTGICTVRKRGHSPSLGMLMGGVAEAAAEEEGWCSLVKLRISSDPRGAAAILGGGGCRNDHQRRKIDCFPDL